MYKTNSFNTVLFKNALFGYKRYLHEAKNNKDKNMMYVYNYIL